MESLVLPSTSELSTLRVLESLDRLLGEVELLQRSQRDSGRRQTETIAACHAIGTDVRRLARLEEKGHAATRELLGRVAETGGQIRVARAHLLVQGHSLSAVAQHARLLGQRKAPRILVVKVGANTPPQVQRQRRASSSSASELMGLLRPPAGRYPLPCEAAALVRYAAAPRRRHGG
ncbi:unnamed protein product [Lampetra planeri]